MEAGFASQRKITDLARLASPPPEPGEDQRIGAAEGAHPLATVAQAVTFAQDPAAPGPTDNEGYLEHLFHQSHLDVWKTWDEAVRQNLQDIAPTQLAKIEAADAKAQRAYDQGVEVMRETGRWTQPQPYGHNAQPTLANNIYDFGREGFLGGQIDWDTGVIRAILVDSADYAVNIATHQYLSSVAAAAREETSGALTTKTITAGVADADDVTFLAAAGDPCEAVILVQSSAATGGADIADTAQRLIAYYDTATGLPITLNGGNVTLAWDSGSLRIFKL